LARKFKWHSLLFCYFEAIIFPNEVLRRAFYNKVKQKVPTNTKMPFNKAIVKQQVTSQKKRLTHHLSLFGEDNQLLFLQVHLHRVHRGQLANSADDRERIVLWGIQWEQRGGKSVARSGGIIEVAVPGVAGQGLDKIGRGIGQCESGGIFTGFQLASDNARLVTKCVETFLKLGENLQHKA
jgi:hypothetical protein